MNIKVRGDIEMSLRRLRKDYDNNVAPSIRRHQYHRSKSQLKKDRLHIKGQQAQRKPR